MRQSQQAKKHHYVPEFYLRQWANEAGKLIEFSHPKHGFWVREVTPGQTGYMFGLYDIEGLPPDGRAALEQTFFAPTDDYAALALKKLDRFEQDSLTTNERSGWSRFLRSLLLRTPEAVASLKSACRIEVENNLELVRRSYEENWRPGDPETFELAMQHFEDNNAITSMWVEVLQTVIDSRDVGEHLNNMIWTVETIPDEARFLTSDRAVIMSGAMLHRDANICLPIGPKKLFIAVNSNETLEKIKRMTMKNVVKLCNNHVTKAARKWVYASDRRQQRFVQNRLQRVDVPRDRIAGEFAFDQ